MRERQILLNYQSVLMYRIIKIILFLLSVWEHRRYFPTARVRINGYRACFGNLIFYLQRMQVESYTPYRNDFLTLTYGQGGTKDHNPKKEFSFSTVLSLGYLIHREGDLIEKHTFRLGAGKLKWTKTTIEPSMYFNNFFKGVTPCIRISQQF